MRRIKLTAAYDGTDFCGFQIQPDMRTVEGELNRALSELTGEEIYVTGASRTDSGVHAEGNVAVFDTVSTIPAERFPYALLPFLPEDIRIVSGCEVQPEWHPRRQDCIKTYEYTFSCGGTENPKHRRYAAYEKRIPDIERMKIAASYLVGEHDFTSFANPSSQVLKEGGSAVRTIYSIDISQEASYSGTGASYQYNEETKASGLNISEMGSNRNSTEMNSDIAASKQYEASPKSAEGNGCGKGKNRLVRIRIRGNGFLYNMVRIIAGTLMSVGTGLREPESVKTALEAKDRTKVGPTAQARGLTLLGIEYVF